MFSSFDDTMVIHVLALLNFCNNSVDFHKWPISKRNAFRIEISGTKAIRPCFDCFSLQYRILIITARFFLWT